MAFRYATRPSDALSRRHELSGGRLGRKLRPCCGELGELEPGRSMRVAELRCGNDRVVEVVDECCGDERE
jgi:hypothetical protein